MKIQLRFFASLRETLNVSHETAMLPAQMATVGDVLVFLRQRGGVWSDALADGRPVRMARNQQMVDSATPVAEGDEIAFFPPVTGG